MTKLERIAKYKRSSLFNIFKHLALVSALQNVFSAKLEFLSAKHLQPSLMFASKGGVEQFKGRLLGFVSYLSSL